MKNTKKLLARIPIFIIALANVAIAENVQILNKHHQHEDIIATVENFVRNSINVNDDSVSLKTKPLDRRLQLRQCEIPLQAFWPPGARQSGHTSVGLRCADDKPWKIYVSTQIRQYVQLWIATAAISRGTILDHSNVALERKEISNNSLEYFSIDQNPAGLVAKRPMRKGDIIQVLGLEKLMAINRGDRVVVIARINGVEIRTAAKALSSAAEGDRIKVQNLSTKKELEGILHKNNMVHVNI